MARRTISLHAAYANAPHGWTLSSAQERGDQVGTIQRRPATPPPRPTVKRTKTEEETSSPREYLFLPDEILLQIIDHLRTDTWTDGYAKARKQCDLNTFSRVNRQWNSIATSFLYDSPHLEGSNYDLFTRTLCPSINLNIRKSPLSSFVKELDLSLLVHQGSKSTTARLLGRTKGSLTSFLAPQASFSLNCFPALSKCQHLEKLDLTLVSEASSLKTLFDTVSNLQALKELHLPRSSGFGATIDPATITWPVKLAILGLSGGLNTRFWCGIFHLPASLDEISITHCPKFDDFCLSAFLETLMHHDECHFFRMEFAHLPLLREDSLDLVLQALPFLHSLSVSVDYVTPEVLNPPGVKADGEAREYLSEGDEYYSGSEHERREELDASGAVDDRTIKARRRKKKKCRSFLKLETLELTDSGERDNTDKIEALDVLMYADDFGMVPKLRDVIVARSLGWCNEDVSDDADALHDWLVDNGESMGITDHDLLGLKVVW